MVAELLVPDETLRRLIVGRAGTAALHACAVASGMESLRRNGLRRAFEGVTSIEEVARVAHEET